MIDLRETYDVVVCGGGPVGLLTAYGLQRMGISTCVIERLEKSKIPFYGRAAALFPRTLELLDQYDLLHPLSQVGFVARNAVNYDKDGKRDNTRGTLRQVFDSAPGNTFLEYMLHIRLKYSEEIIQREYEKIGGVVMVKYELMKLLVGRASDTNGETGETGEYPVKVEIRSVGSLETKSLAGKYLIGADGAHSTVRRLSGITSTEDATTLRWVRIDGVVETDMPDAHEGIASLESPTHGNVLWVNLDHGRSRVGFALSAALLEKYGEHLTQREIMEEAKAAFKPFSLEFKSVDWFTVYGVRHSVADTFIKDRIILAGDACHAHSSGTAQGMNTGVHDAVNLAWKLAGVLKNWYHPSILSTYNSERRPIAERLIQLDKTFAALISGKIPPELAAISSDPNVLITKTSDENIQFTTGLGINYSLNPLNAPTRAGTLPSGRRAVDVLVYAPGSNSRLPTRLQTITKNVGTFWVVVFAGEPLLTKGRLKTLRVYLDSPAATSFLRTTASDAINRRPGQRIRFLTIVAGNKPQAEETMGASRFGDVYYDHDSTAHARYGVSTGEGGVIVIRPDGILGFATRLDSGKDVADYFAGIFVPFLGPRL